MLNQIISSISAIGSICAGIAAIIGISIAKKQLTNIKDEIKIGIENQKSESLKIVLEIETQMNSRKLEFDKASKQVREAEFNKAPDELFSILNDYFDSVKESYFNSLDRLCYCIDKEYILDKDWRTEYRNLLKETIDKYPDDFNEASPYHNMKKINKIWQTT